MKVLFLDMDGVCNCLANFQNEHQGVYQIDPDMMARVQRIVRETGCEVVLSSSWRMDSDGRDAVKKHVKLRDITPVRGGLRGEEVKIWLRWHPEYEVYAILDDSSDFYGYQHLFRTRWDTGLTDEIADAVIKHLNGVE